MPDDDAEGYDAVGSTFRDRAIARTDKLTYRQILQRLLLDCYQNMQRLESLRPRVIALVTSINFSIEGLPFKEKIAEAKETFLDDKEKYIEEQLKKISAEHIYYHPKSLDDLNPIDKWRICYNAEYQYYRNLLEFIVDLLAKHQGLTEPKSFIPQGSDYQIR